MSEKKNFKTAALMKEMMRNYYAQGATAKKRHTGCLGDRSLSGRDSLCGGIFPYYPENFGALASARKVADKLSLAEAKDTPMISRLCLLRNWRRLRHRASCREILAPDVIFCCNTQCGTLPKWLKQPAGTIITLLPARFASDTDQPEELITDYYVDQLKEMISFLEEITGEPSTTGA